MSTGSLAMAEARARAGAIADAAERLAAACVAGARRSGDERPHGPHRTRSTSSASAAPAWRGIAEVLLNLGYAVQRLGLEAHGASTERLAALGAQVRDRPRGRERRRAPTSSSCRARSQADNPEVLAARARRIPVVRARRDARASSCASATAIAVAGTHGKTTTTSLIASVLAEGGVDPTFVIGGRLQERGSEREARRSASISSPRPTRATRRSCTCSR